MTNGRDRQSGMTLVELLVAMALSGLLVAGMYSVYLSMQRTNYNQEDITDTQQTLRIAMEAISRDIRMAGACVGSDSSLESSTNGSTLILNMPTADCITNLTASDVEPNCPNVAVTWKYDEVKGLVRNEGGSDLIFADKEKVEKIAFTYLDEEEGKPVADEAGTPVIDFTDAVDRNSVASIRIQLELLADRQSAADDVPRSLVSVVRLMNRK